MAQKKNISFFCTCEHTASLWQSSGIAANERKQLKD